MGFRSDVALQTPINFGLIQEVGLDFSFDTKELYGQYQFPLAIARGKGKVGGKAKLARISALAFGTLFFGIAPIAGQTATAFGEGPTPIPTTPFQITATNGATFVDDLGVINSATGLPLTKVASGPTTGQYSVSAAGVYTFASADNVSAISVLLNYTYTIPATGSQIKVVNSLLGFTPTFTAQLYTTFQNKTVNLRLPNCTSSKLTFPTKLDDFVMPDLDFAVYADVAGNIGNWSFSEAS